MAQSISLNMTDFNACFQADTYKSQIDQDFSDGQAKGITGTPSVFVDGTILTPGYIPSYDQIAQAVDAASAGH
jgi:protein-disulfide isomerase